MTEAGSFIKSDLLKDIRGRSRFVSTPLNEHLEKCKDPSPPAVPDLFTAEDRLYLDKFGVDSKEMVLLLDEARRQAFSHPGVEAKLKDLLTLTKLSGGTRLRAALTSHKTSVENRKQDLLRRDTTYQRKCNDAKAKRVQLEKTWNNVSDQVRTRWKRILKSLTVALSRFEHWSDLHPSDKYAISFLEMNCPKLVEIKDNRVVKFDAEMLAFIDLAIIRELVDNLLVEETKGAPQDA